MVRMFKRIFESFLSKLEELIADSALDNVKSIKDLELTLKSLQKNLKSLSAKASDVKEEIENAEASGQKKRKREVEEWLEEVELIENEVVELGREVESAGFISRLMGEGNAEQLNKQVDKLVEQSRNFGELLLDVRGSRGVSLLTTTMVGRAFEQNLGRIWRLLVTGKVSSIGIHGMGGAGKTTLAKRINNRILEQSQGCVFWVTVSHEFTIKSLQDKIAHNLGISLMGEDDEDIRASRLHGALSQQKNAVVILDDVWENINLLKVGCPFSVECCRVIITTRSLEVCRQIGCQEIVSVQKLDEDEAWKLFIETFTLGKEIKLGPQIEEIAKSMARWCDGLPLGIITLAGSMRGETTIHAWKNALEELMKSVTGQDGDMGEYIQVFKVLKYSFDRLNRNHGRQSNEELNMIQLCFLYCSLYPEDYEIPREELVGKFISEGLLDQRKSRRAQFDQGYCILDKLVKVCLLESCVERFSDIECVKMHDLVRGMALQIVGGKYMVRAGDMSLKEIPMEEEWTEDLEKVSLMKNVITVIPDGTSPNCPNLSTLLLQRNIHLEFIPDSFFTKMQGLCTLDLSRTLIKMLPNSVSELKSLKALLLEHCRMLESVPYLGKLKALTELNLDGTAIKDVPQGVEELLNLKFLSVNARKLEILPEGLLVKLVRLQYMKFPFHVRVPVQGIENLKQVERFWGRLNNVSDFNSFIKSRVHDTFYTIRVESFEEEEEKEVEKDCLGYLKNKQEEEESFEEEEDCLGYLKNKEVIMNKCNLNDEKVLGQNIQCLAIIQCESLSNCFLDEFSPSNYPTSLKELKIERCGGIECIVRSEQELVASQLSSLEDLELVELEDFEGVMIEKGGMELEGVFSSLRRLTISSCNKMGKLGLPVLGFPNLEEIRIWYCSEIEEIFEDEGRASTSLTLPKLKMLSLCNLPRLKSVCKASILAFPNLEQIHIWGCSEMEEIFEEEGRAASLALTLTLPKLKELRLMFLPRLKSVCKATIICNSIQIIRIWRCPILMKKLPLHLDVPPPPSLNDIAVSREWWESLEWDNPNLPTLLQPFLHLSI